MLLESICEKMNIKFYLLPDEEWLRGLSNNFKELYSKIKEKLILLCD